jgi:PPOX class probable F420-dependent enzyme
MPAVTVPERETEGLTMDRHHASQEVQIPGSHVSILEKVQLATVSTIRHKDGYISTNPVGFLWDGEYLRFSTLKERVKYENLRHNPQITVCVVDPEDATRYIEIRGVAEFSDDPDREFLQRVVNHYKGPNEDPEFDFDSPGTQRVIVKVIPHQVSAPLLYGGRLADSLECKTIPAASKPSS